MFWFYICMQGVNGVNFNTASVFKDFSVSNVADNKQFLYTTVLNDIAKNNEIAARKKDHNIKLVGASVAALFTIGTFALVIAKDLKSGKLGATFNEIASAFKKGSDAVGNTIKDGVQTITGDKRVKPVLNGIVNASNNFTTIKDDLWDRLAKKTRILDIMGRPFTDLYMHMLRKSTGKEYAKIFDELKAKFGVEALKKAGIESFDDWFLAVSKGAEKAFHGKENPRVTRTIFEKGFFKGLKRLVNETLADTQMGRVFKHSTLDKPIDMSDFFKLTGIEKTDDAVELLTKFNNQKLKTAELVIPKVRDIICGNAPTDVIGIGIAAGGFGAAIHSADTKEERKSLTYNLGIPLLTTIGASIYSTCKAISGGPALVFGLATGQLGSMAAKAIDKIQNGSKKNENNKA